MSSSSIQIGTTRDNPTPRPAARVIVLDGCGRVLLFRIALPGREHLRLWITPGGGLEPGETHEQAALRELREETGVSDAELGPFVWNRRHVFWWIDEWIEQLERYYLLRAPGIVVRPPSLEELEKEYLREYRWWTIDELEAADTEAFAPRMLPELLRPLVEGHVPQEPIEVGI